MSEDFRLFKPSLSPIIQREIENKTLPNISFKPVIATALEEQARISFSAASSREWFLATLGQLLRELLTLLQNGSASGVDIAEV